MLIKKSSTFIWSVVAIVTLTILSIVFWRVSPTIVKTEYAQTSEKNERSSLGSCEKCGKPLRTVSGKYGDFIGCSGYPDCTYVQRKKASFCCPQCAGCVEQRTWKHGILWGCNNYPQCRYAIFSDIEDRPCSQCDKFPYMLKKTDTDGNITLKCPNENCQKNAQANEK
ncbi:MAG TPA: type I DNA topoisomerase [Candidatus Saccharimonadales bacterium]|nr:type I DNA topoisomerase [Candidatus Saccharimonadales bacterium]